MMSIVGKRELLAEVGPRYRAATGQATQQILTAVVASTGYHPKYAITVLNHPPTASVPAPRRRDHGRHYPLALAAPLEQLWERLDRPCGTRLVAGLPGLLEAVDRHGGLVVPAEDRALLLAMRAATAARLLAGARAGTVGGAVARARRSAGLTESQRAVPTRRWAEWLGAPLGSVQVDLVFHRGPVAGGEPLYTLTLTDVPSGWTVWRGWLNRSQQTVFAALTALGSRLPFPLVALHSDNGQEFINALRRRYAGEHGLRFTRDRAGQSNDQAHVEQKNGAHVRHFVGYDRYTGADACAARNALYAESLRVLCVGTGGRHSGVLLPAHCSRAPTAYGLDVWPRAGVPSGGRQDHGADGSLQATRALADRRHVGTGGVPTVRLHPSARSGLATAFPASVMAVARTRTGKILT